MFGSGRHDTGKQSLSKETMQMWDGRTTLGYRGEQPHHLNNVKILCLTLLIYRLCIF